MTDLIPEGYISLLEAFERFRLMRHGSIPEWLEEPEDPDERDSWKKLCLDAHRDDLDEMRGAFESGQLKALVGPKGGRDGNTKISIEQDDWRQARDVSDLFLFEDIFDFHDGPMAKYRGRRPFVDEVAFNGWVEANDPDAIHAKRPRWGLFATLAWIATRDMKLSRLADQAGNSLNGIDILLRDWAIRIAQEASRTWPYRTASEAWEMELVPTLSAGSLQATAARTLRRRDGSSEQTELGQIFPPNKAPAAAEHSIIRTGREGPVLFQSGAQGAQHWVEWSNLAFDKRTVMKFWPSAADHLGDMDRDSRTASAKPPRVAENELSTWFKKRVAAWPSEDAYPTREKDWQDAKAAFPDKRVPRSLIDSLRKVHAPFEWNKQGPRKAG